MRWTSLGRANRITVVALAGSAVAEIVGVAFLGEFNAFAVVFTLVLAGLAALATTGRWVALAFATGLSVLLTVVAVMGTMDRLGEPGQSGQLAAASIFSILVLVAAVTGAMATVHAYRNRHLGSEQVVA